MTAAAVRQFQYIMKRIAKRSALLLAAGLLCLAAVISGCGPDLPLSTPQWSATGDRVVFVRYTTSGSTLMVLDPASEDAPKVVAEGVERFAIAGDKLFFLRPAPEDKKSPDKPGLMSVDVARAGEAKAQLVLPAPEETQFVRLDPAGRGIVYIECRGNDGKGAVIEYDSTTGKQRPIPPRNTDCLATRASPNGAELAVLAPAKDGGLVLLVAATNRDVEPTELGRLEKADSSGAGLAWSPAGDRLVVWYTEQAEQERGVARLVLFEPARGEKSRRALELPRADAPVGAASFGTDGSKLFFTLLATDKNGDDEKIVAESYSLDLPAGKAKLLARAPEKLVGARSYSGDGKRWVEFTPTGLALFEGNRAEPERLWPLDGAERIAAARAALAAGRHERAAQLITAGLESASPGDDRGELSRLKADALDGAGKGVDAANAYLEGLLRYPVTAKPDSDTEIAKRLEKYADAQPANRLLFALAAAWKQRSAGQFDKAAAAFREASALSADQAWSAGINFAAARSLLDAGKPLTAAVLLRKVSETNDHPQADWAALLAAAAYSQASRDDLAAEELQRFNDVFAKSALTDDAQAMAKALAAQPTKPRNAEEVKSPEAGVAARLEAWPATAVHLSFAPTRAITGGTARVAAVRYEQWRLVLAAPEGEKVLLDKVPLPLGRLGFSPDGKKLAFLAGPAGKQSLYAVDLAGAAQLGDLKKLAAGEADPNTTARDYRWPDGAALPAAVK